MGCVQNPCERRSHQKHTGIIILTYAHLDERRSHQQHTGIIILTYVHLESMIMKDDWVSFSTKRSFSKLHVGEGWLFGFGGRVGWPVQIAFTGIELE